MNNYFTNNFGVVVRYGNFSVSCDSSDTFRENGLTITGVNANERKFLSQEEWNKICEKIVGNVCEELKLGDYTLTWATKNPQHLYVKHKNGETWGIRPEKWNEIFNKLWENYYD